MKTRTRAISIAPLVPKKRVTVAVVCVRDAAQRRPRRAMWSWRSAV